MELIKEWLEIAPENAQNSEFRQMKSLVYEYLMSIPAKSQFSRLIYLLSVNGWEKGTYH